LLNAFFAGPEREADNEDTSRRPGRVVSGTLARLFSGRPQLVRL
jgi:hypothetical protein